MQVVTTFGSQESLSPLNESTLTGILGSLFPSTLRKQTGDSDNAIEYRNIMLLGAQGSGKTTTVQSLALALSENYGAKNTVFAIQVAGIDRLLSIPTKIPARCWISMRRRHHSCKAGKSQINRFFQVRHVIAEQTGLREGMCVTIFNTHTFHGLEKNLRDTFNALIIKSVPTNPYDRSILRRYFDPWLLDEFARGWSIDKALVWTPQHPHGILVHVQPPAASAIKNVTVRHSLWSRLFGLEGR